MSNDNWHTPDYIVDAVRQVFRGPIDLDPASCLSAQEGIGRPGKRGVDAARFFDKHENGLAQNWWGSVYLNPPYSMPKIAQFTNKAFEEYESGRAGQILILTNNATETAWFQSLLRSYYVCFFNHRIKFWMPGKLNADSPRQAQVMFYLGENKFTFYEVFRHLGTIRPGGWTP